MDSSSRFPQQDPIIRINAADVFSDELSPLAEDSGLKPIQELAKRTLSEQAAKPPGVHVTLADKVVVYNTADVQRASIARNILETPLQKGVIGNILLHQTKNPDAAKKMEVLAHVLEPEIRDQLRENPRLEAKFNQLKGTGLSILSCLQSLRKDPGFTDLIDKAVNETIGKFGSDPKDTKKLTDFLASEQGQRMFKERASPESINTFFQTRIFSEVRGKAAAEAGASAGVQPNVSASGAKYVQITPTVDMSFQPTKEKRLVSDEQYREAIKPLGIQTAKLVISSNLRKYDEDAQGSSSDVDPEEHATQMQEAVAIYMKLSSEERRAMGAILQKQGVSQNTIKDFLIRIKNPDLHFRTTGDAKPDKPAEFWTELDRDADIFLKGYQAAQKTEVVVNNDSKMSAAAKATGLKVMEAASWGRSILNSLEDMLRSVGEALGIVSPKSTAAAPYVGIEHKGKQLHFKSDDVAQAAFKHHLATTPLLRGVDGTIEVNKSGLGVGVKTDHSAHSQMMIGRKRDALQDMLHDTIQIQTAISIAADEMALNIAKEQIKTAPLHPITKVPLSLAQLESIARREIEAVLPNTKMIEALLLKGSSIGTLTQVVANYMEAAIGRGDVQKQKMLSGLVDAFKAQMDVGETLREFTGRFGFQLNDKTKLFNAKFGENLSKELERYDNMAPGSVEYKKFMQFLSDNPKYTSFRQTPEGIGLRVGSGERVMSGRGVQDFIAKRVVAFANGTLGSVSIKGDNEDMATAGFFALMTGDTVVDKDNLIKWPGTPEAEALKKRDARAEGIRTRALEQQAINSKPKTKMAASVEGIAIEGGKIVSVKKGVVAAPPSAQPEIVKLGGKEFVNLSLAEFNSKVLGTRGDFPKRLQNLIERGNPTYAERQEKAKAQENAEAASFYAHMGIGIVTDTDTEVDNMYGRAAKIGQKPIALMEGVMREGQSLAKYADDCIAFLQEKLITATPEEYKVIKEQIAALKDQSDLLHQIVPGKMRSALDKLQSKYDDIQFARSYMEKSNAGRLLDRMDRWIGAQLGRVQLVKDDERMNRILETHSRSGFYDMDMTRLLEKYMSSMLVDLESVAASKKMPGMTAGLKNDLQKLREAISAREFVAAFLKAQHEEFPIWKKLEGNTWTYECSAKKPDGKGWEQVSSSEVTQHTQVLIKKWATAEKLQNRDPVSEDVRRMFDAIPPIVVDKVSENVRVAEPKDLVGNKEEINKKIGFVVSPKGWLEQGKLDTLVKQLEVNVGGIKTPEDIQMIMQESLAVYALLNRGLGDPDVNQSALSAISTRLEQIIDNTARLARLKAPQFDAERRAAGDARKFAGQFFASVKDQVPLWRQQVAGNWVYQSSAKAPEGAGWSKLSRLESMDILAQLVRTYVTTAKIEEGDLTADAIMTAAGRIAEGFEIFEDDEKPSQVMQKLERDISTLENIQPETVSEAEGLMRKALTLAIFLKRPDEARDADDIEAMTERLEVIMNTVAAKINILKEREAQFDKLIIDSNRSEDAQHLFKNENGQLVLSTVANAKNNKFLDPIKEIRALVKQIKTLEKDGVIKESLAEGGIALPSTEDPKNAISKALRQVNELNNQMLVAVTRQAGDTLEAYLAQYALTQELMVLMTELETAGLVIKKQADTERQDLQNNADRLKGLVIRKLANEEANIGLIFNHLNNSLNRDMNLAASTFINLPHELRKTVGQLLKDSNVKPEVADAFVKSIQELLENPEIRAAFQGLGIPKEFLINLSQDLQEIREASTSLKTQASVVEAQEKQFREKAVEDMRKVDNAQTPDAIREAIRQMPDVVKAYDKLVPGVRAELQRLNAEQQMLTASINALAPKILERAGTDEEGVLTDSRNVLDAQRMKVQNAIDSLISELKDALKDQIKLAAIRNRPDLRKLVRDEISLDIALTTVADAAGVDKALLKANLEMRDKVMSGKADKATQKEFASQTANWFKDNHINPELVDRIRMDMANNPHKIEFHPDFVRRLEEEVTKAAPKSGIDKPVSKFDNAAKRDALEIERMKERFSLVADAESHIDEIVEGLLAYPKSSIENLLEDFVALPYERRKELGEILVQQHVSKEAIHAFSQAIKKITRDAPHLVPRSIQSESNSQTKEIKLKRFLAEIEIARSLMADALVKAAQPGVELEQNIQSDFRKIDAAQDLQALRKTVAHFPDVVKLFDQRVTEFHAEIKPLEREFHSLYALVTQLSKQEMALKTSNPAEANRLQKINTILKQQIADIVADMNQLRNEFKDGIKDAVRFAHTLQNPHIREEVRKELANKIAVDTVAASIDTPPAMLEQSIKMHMEILNGKADGDTIDFYKDNVEKFFKDKQVMENYEKIFKGLMAHPEQLDAHKDFNRMVSARVPAPTMVVNTSQRDASAVERQKMRAQIPDVTRLTKLNAIAESWKGHPFALELRVENGQVAFVGRDNAHRNLTRPITLQEFRKFRETASGEFMVYSTKLKEMREGRKDITDQAIAEACYGFVNEQLNLPQSDDNRRFLEGQKHILEKTLLMPASRPPKSAGAALGRGVPAASIELPSAVSARSASIDKPVESAVVATPTLLPIVDANLTPESVSGASSSKGSSSATLPPSKPDESVEQPMTSLATQLGIDPNLPTTAKLSEFDKMLTELDAALAGIEEAEMEEWIESDFVGPLPPPVYPSITLKQIKQIETGLSGMFIRSRKPAGNNINEKLLDAVNIIVSNATAKPIDPSKVQMAIRELNRLSVLLTGSKAIATPARKHGHIQTLGPFDRSISTKIPQAIKNAAKKLEDMQKELQ